MRASRTLVLPETGVCSQLPAFLGGTCTCECEGGCLMADKGPWNDPEVLRVSGWRGEGSGPGGQICTHTERVKARDIEWDGDGGGIRHVPPPFQAVRS